jgi:aminoglycoside N3'-acetyltransferase
MDTITYEVLKQDFLKLGVKPGGILLVHTSFSKVKPVEDGSMDLITALRSALGSHGTLIMLSMSYDDNHPFDKTSSPCPEMGIVADTF